MTVVCLLLIQLWNEYDLIDFSNATYQKMLAILAQCETTMAKSVEVYNMNLKEQENYESLNERIGNGLVFQFAVLSEMWFSAY